MCASIARVACSVKLNNKVCPPETLLKTEAYQLQKQVHIPPRNHTNLLKEHVYES